MDNERQQKIFRENNEEQVLGESYLNLILKDIKGLFIWWFLTIPSRIISWGWRFFLIIEDTLSFTALSKTFFIPLFNKKKALNIITGITIRFILLPIEALILLVIIMIELVIFFLWLLFPILLLYFLILTPLI